MNTINNGKRLIAKVFSEAKYHPELSIPNSNTALTEVRWIDGLYHLLNSTFINKNSLQ